MPTLPPRTLRSSQQEGGQGLWEAPGFWWRSCVSAVLQEHLTHHGDVTSLQH